MKLRTQCDGSVVSKGWKGRNEPREHAGPGGRGLEGPVKDFTLSPKVTEKQGRGVIGQIYTFTK